MSREKRYNPNNNLANVYMPDNSMPFLAILKTSSNLSLFFKIFSNNEITTYIIFEEGGHGRRRASKWEN